MSLQENAELLLTIQRMQREIDALKPAETPRGIYHWVYPSMQEWVTNGGTANTPLTSTSWDGDSYSTTAKTLIDLSAVFGVPAGVKAVDLWVEINDSGSAATDCWLLLSPNNTAYSGKYIGLHLRPNDANERISLTVPCDENGDIYYQINASGTGTMDVNIMVWGYYI
jgi:hypothetical protein